MKLIFAPIVLIISFFVYSGVEAQVIQISTPQCQAPYYIPSACPTPYVPEKSAGYTADLNCQLAKFADPENLCCPNICVDLTGRQILNQENPEIFNNLEVFNTTIKINPDSTPAFINILFTTVLGFVSVYAIIRGIYVTGVKDLWQ